MPNDVREFSASDQGYRHKAFHNAHIDGSAIEVRSGETSQFSSETNGNMTANEFKDSYEATTYGIVHERAAPEFISAPKSNFVVQPHQPAQVTCLPRRLPTR
jgi:hypothetical protein